MPESQREKCGAEDDSFRQSFLTWMEKNKIKKNAPLRLRTTPIPFPTMITRQRDTATLNEFEARTQGMANDPERNRLLEEMRQHTEALNKQRKHEDPRMSFSTPEYKDFSRRFTEGFKKNFGKPIEWGLVKRYPWSQPQLMRLDVPLDHEGNPWPLDEKGKPILKE